MLQATRASEIIDSIKGGMIHVEERGNNGLKVQSLLRP